MFSLQVVLVEAFVLLPEIALALQAALLVRALVGVVHVPRVGVRLRGEPVRGTPFVDSEWIQQSDFAILRRWTMSSVADAVCQWRSAGGLGPSCSLQGTIQSSDNNSVSKEELSGTLASRKDCAELGTHDSESLR